MLRPSLEEFESCSRRGNLIPVAREILADLDTPLSLFRRIDDGRTSFLLESVEGGEKWARYSFLGTGARATFTAHGRNVVWVEWVAGEKRTEVVTTPADPLEFLREKLRSLHHVTPEGVDWPRFIGGAVGMIGYDWVRFVERLPDPKLGSARRWGTAAWPMWRPGRPRRRHDRSAGHRVRSSEIGWAARRSRRRIEPVRCPVAQWARWR